MDDDGREIVRSSDIANLAAAADVSSTSGPGEDVVRPKTTTGSSKSAATKDAVAEASKITDDAADNDADISPPEPPQQVLDEQQRQQQQQHRELTASPLPSARALLERVLPHVRFPMIKPEQLALLEEDAFVRKYFASFEAYMVNAYKYHAVPKEHRLACCEFRMPDKQGRVNCNRIR